MFTHVMVGANDIEAAEKFYTAALGALGIQGGRQGDRCFYGAFGSGAFGVGKPRDGEAASQANGGTIGFAAKTRVEVDAFHAAGERAGAPGSPYGAYLRDPEGNKICAFTTAK